MSEALIYLDPDSGLSLQNQIRQKLVDSIMSGTFPPGQRLPSSRRLAEQLGVSRNTVVLAYEQLVEEGFLDSRERSGIYVSEDVLEGRVGFQRPPASQLESDEKWERRIRGGVVGKPRFQWPADWQQHPYPFIDGQFDDSLYPTTQWREANRMAMGARIVREGSVTDGDADDPVLIEEIRTKMLPRRGINANPDEILIIKFIQGIFRSTDGGATFGLAPYGTGVSGDVRQLTQDPNDADTLYVRDGNQVFKSTDFGATWNALSLVGLYSSLKSLAAAPTGDDLLAVDAFNVYHSSDSGSTWSAVSSVVPYSGLVFDCVEYAPKSA